MPNTPLIPIFFATIADLKYQESDIHMNTRLAVSADGTLNLTIATIGVHFCLHYLLDD
jgi:hypothetical protein